jgi:hypothetical protein
MWNRLQGFNPHLPFGDHLLGHFFYFLIGTRGFFAFTIIYNVNEGV